MKFGKELERLALPRWKDDYIQYKELKKAVKVFTGQDRDQSTVQEVTHWTSSFLRLGPNPEKTPEARLLDVIMSELDRIGKFTKLEEESIRTQLERAEEECRKLGQVAECGEWRRKSVDQLVASLDEIGEHTVQLKGFAQVNFRGFRKVLKKYDKWSRSSVMPWVMGKVINSPFMQVDYDVLLLRFSKVASSLASRSTTPTGANLSYSQGQVHFVETKDSMRVKVQLAKHLGLSFVGGGEKCTRSSVIFYDTPTLSVYSAYQEAKTEPLDAVHIKMNEGSNDLCLVHEQAGAGRREAWLSRTDASRLLGASGDSAWGSNNEVAEAFRAALRIRSLTPIAQGTYLRSIFRDEASGITAIFDEDVRMSRIEDWDGPTSGAADFFPYSLLSIHTDPGKGSKEAPKWLNCSNMFQVSGFSKAAHMVGHFRAQECGVPLPHWQSRVANCADQSHEPAEIQGENAQSTVLGHAPQQQEENAGRPRSESIDKKRRASRALLHSFDTSPEEKDMLDISSGAAADIVTVPAKAGGLADPLLDRPEGGGVDTVPEQKGWCPWFPFSRGGSKPIRKAIVAVQPKTLNSLERTYLEWIHFVTLLATVGVFLMHTGSERGIGRFLVLASIMLLVRVHCVFTWRAEALDFKNDVEYHDPVTPIVLVAGIIVGVSWSSLGAIGAIQFSV